MIKIGKDIRKFSTYSYQPKTKYELNSIIKSKMDKEGPNCSLNDIDVSQIDDMSLLFSWSEFDGDISEWDVSNVEDMKNMFAFSIFNGDISDWDVSSVTDMAWMFNYSSFNQDISNWKISKNCDTSYMLLDCHIKEEFKPKSLQK